MSSTLQQSLGSGFNAASTAEEVMQGVDLTGKVAIVTGGYSGLGRETVRAGKGVKPECLISVCQIWSLKRPSPKRAWHAQAETAARSESPSPIPHEDEIIISCPELDRESLPSGCEPKPVLRRTLTWANAFGRCVRACSSSIGQPSLRDPHRAGIGLPVSV